MVRFQKTSLIHAPLEAVWQLHERDDALELLSPPWARPQIMLRKGCLRTGSRVEMKVPLGPFRVKWLALHIDYEEHHHFTDQQIRGPFQYWTHVHLFERDGDNTRLTDRVECKLPLSPVTDWVGGWAVRWQLRRMFNYRHRVTEEQVSLKADSAKAT